MKKKTGSTDYPQTRQQRFPGAEDELDLTNAIPRCTEYDLRQGHEFGHKEEMNPSQDLEYSRFNECTYTSPKRGNKVTEGKNY